MGKSERNVGSLASQPAESMWVFSDGKCIGQLLHRSKIFGKDTFLGLNSTPTDGTTSCLSHSGLGAFTREVTMTSTLVHHHDSLNEQKVVNCPAINMWSRFFNKFPPQFSRNPDSCRTVITSEPFPVHSHIDKEGCPLGR